MKKEDISNDQNYQTQPDAKQIKRLFSSSTIVASSNKFFNLRNRSATSETKPTLIPAAKCDSLIAKNEFLAHLNLKPIKIVAKSSQKTLRSSKIKPDYDKFRVDESNLDLNKSISDQILKQNGHETKNTEIITNQEEKEPFIVNE
jgi:hypothetical protein